MRLLTIILAFCFSASAADYCSLAVKVIDPQGREPETLVSVRERDGRVTQHENARGGVGFCNLGITPVEVTVGPPSCNQAIVRNVPVDWAEERKITILYDPAPCMVDTPPVAACEFLLRFVAAGGEPISGVRFELEKPYEQAWKADRFGRVMIRIAAGQQMSGVATHQGLAPAEVAAPCVTQNRLMERYVTLRGSNP